MEGDNQEQDTQKSMTIQPPVLGWNTKDPISAMDPSYAVDAENFFSNGASVDLRMGYRMWAKNVGAAPADTANTTWEFALQNGTRKQITISSTGTVFDTTAGGSAPTDISGGAGKLVGNATCVVFQNRIWIKDRGAHGLFFWDGITGTITASTFTGPGGADVLMYQPQPFKSRLYFCGIDLSVWYGDIDGVSGALTRFNMASNFTLGGQLLWAGGIQKQGQTDQQYFAAISTQGEVLLYQGDYPGSQTWGLVGQFFMPPPVGFRSFVFWGANLLIMTYSGIIPLTEVLKGGDTLTPLSDKINDQFVSAFSGLSGLLPDYVSGVFYPKGNMLIFNIPNAYGTAYNQFVMSTLTGGWWKWSNIKAYHWGLFNGDLYFGGDNEKVFKAWNGYFDEDPAVDAGVLNRTVKLRPAYNYFGDSEHVKQFLEARPIIYESQGLDLTMDADVDYANTTATSRVTDTADTSYKLYRPKMGLMGIGKAASIRIDGTVSTKQRSIQAIEVFWSEAGLT